MLQQTAARSTVETEPEPRTIELLGYGVYRGAAEECAAEAIEWIRTGDRCRWAACLNPHSYAVAKAQAPFSQALGSADWLLPDGAGVVLAARLLGRPLPGRVTGMDLFTALHGQGSAAERPLSVFLLGSTDDTLTRVAARLARECPGVRVAGVHSPPFAPEFTPEQSEVMIAAINAAGADVLWVSMTAPKQELWLQQHVDRLHVRFAAAVGAVFDFYTGKVKRSHPLAQRMGLEWLPRLLREPRRLWRRTFVSAPLFLRDVAAEMIRARRNGTGA